MKTVILASLLLFALLLSNNFTVPTIAQPQEYCANNCGMRCQKAGMQDRCLKYCGICCERCKCVPSGTYGNKHECPCYRDMLSSKGKPKCP